MTPTAEVVLCTYNGSAYIVEQLDSIARQTRRIDRLSISDDGSSDDTVVKARRFLALHTPGDIGTIDIRINPVRLGYRENFAQAIARATGDVLFLCDQDDIWERDKVDVLLELMSSRDAAMAFSNGTIVDNEGRSPRRRTVVESYGLDPAALARFHDSAFDRLLKRNYVNGAACAVRRVAAHAALPLPDEIPHDYWFAIWCALHGGVVATPKPLYRYRVHARNTIGIGSDHPLHVWLGIWRHSRVSRARELRIWRAALERIAAAGRIAESKSAAQKVEWLSRVVAGQRTVRRGASILESVLDGSYRRFSAGDALLRDLVSLIRA